MTHLLGIDIGTSSVRAAVVDAQYARIIAVASREYTISIPQSGYAEQDPEDWWEATIATVHDVLALAHVETVAAIGFSGQMHGTVLLDRHGTPIRPAIIWADQRSATLCDDLLARVGEDEYVRITGTRPAAGFQAVTLMWLAQNTPEILEQTHRVLLPKDYVRFRMAGTTGTDITDAAGTGLFNIHKEEWSEDILRAAGVPIDLLPKVHRSYDIVGELQPKAANELGLPAGIPVVAGCADQPAQAIGNGITSPGVASITVGSGGQVFLPIVPTQSTSPKTDARLHVFNHAAPGYYALGAILSAGLAMRWLRDVLGLRDYPNAYALLSSGAASVRPGAEGLIFLPYLSGERTPHMDACARGAFIGLGAHHQRGHMARAVMEGITFALKQALNLCEQLGERAGTIIVSGGGMESTVWQQILADTLQRPLYKSQQSEQSVLGAALIAGVGLGIFGDTIEGNFAHIKSTLAPTDIVAEPHTINAAFYEERYIQFSNLYERLREDMHILARCKS